MGQPHNYEHKKNYYYFNCPIKTNSKQSHSTYCLSYFFRVCAVILLFSSSANGQGCSDAGFCSLNSIKPSGDDSLSSKNNQVKIGAFYGIADNSISVWGNALEYNREFSNKFVMDLKLTSLSQNGNGISAYGLSDIFLTGNYKPNDNLKFTIGAKIPFTNGNNKRNNVSLPMDYQSSLGTVDFLVAFGFKLKKFQLALAVQQPITQNKNQFDVSDYPINSPIRQFQSTRNFIRSGDVFLRISRPIAFTSKMKFTPGLLPIYHLSNDSYTDSSGTKREIAGSAGLTLNGNISLDVELTTKSTLQFSAAAPFIVRDTRPDGLTRSLIGVIEYSVRF